MKRIIPILLCAVTHLPAAAEMKEITAIREYYTDILKKIKDGSICQRELSLQYPVAPGAGPTSSRVRIFYDMPAGSDGRYEYSIVRIENYFQHAATVFYEECLFNSKGDLLFYYGRRGTGDILRTGGIAWDRDERYYFRGEKPIRVMRGEEINDRPGPAETGRAAAIQQHAEELRTKSCLVSFPAPVLFGDE